MRKLKGNYHAQEFGQTEYRIRIEKWMCTMETKRIPRNGIVDIMRLVFACLIAIYHFYSNGEKHFHGGYFGVEYFSILAGLLLFSNWNHKHIELLPARERQRYWLKYIKRRYSRFLRYSLIAFAFAFLVVRVWQENIREVSGFCNALSGDLWEILLIKMNGLNGSKGLLNNPAWTLSSMLYVEFFILGMLALFEHKFLFLLMPLSVIGGIGYWYNLEEVKPNLWVFHTFTTFGVLRVYVLMCCGIFSFWVCKKLEKTSFSMVGQWVLTLAELSGYAICILLVFYCSGKYYQFCFVLITTLVLAISFSGKSFTKSIFPANGVTEFYAEFSLSLYLTHYIVYRIFAYLYTDINNLYHQKFVFLFCVLAVALIYTYIMRGVSKMLPIVKQKLKSVMLEES